MKCEIIDSTIRLIPESADEISKFRDLFPSTYLRTSKVIKSKGFVDEFGSPTGVRYLLIRGFDEAELKKPEKVKIRGMVP